MMASIDQLSQALINADRAGDTQAARALAAEIQRMRASPPQPAAQAQPKQPAQNNDSGSFWDEVKGGIASAPINAYLGVKQMLPGGLSDIEKNVLQQNRAAADKAPVSSFVGNMLTYAPLSMVPGANTVLGGAMIGGATGVMQPTVGNESRMANTLTGAALGGAVPAIINGAKAVKAAAIDPFTEAGRTRIAGGVFNRMAGDEAGAVQQRLATARGNTPGFTPSVAQAARNDGISAFERTMRAVDPQPFGQLDKSQRGALAEALMSVAKSPEERAAALAAADASAKNLYGAALKEQMPVTPELVKLASRPSMKMAESRAVQLGQEIGAPFQASLEDLRPKYVGVQGTPQTASVQPKLTPSQQYLGVPQPDVHMQFPPMRGSLLEIPPVESVPVRDMHTLKMGMDALMGDPTLGIAGREAAAINATRNRLVDLMPESYQQARLSHIEMNKPVHQMDIGRELYNKFVPALADQGNLPFKTTAQNYANALLRNGDDLAKNVTGLKNATLEGIMEPQQLSLLRGVAKDAESKAAAEAGGRGVGSDTVQKLSMSNIAAEAGIPNWMSSVARVPGGWVKRAGDVLYGNADDQVRKQLAYLLTNPQEAAGAMQAAGANPSLLAEMLKKGAQGVGLSVAPTLIGQ